MNNQDKPKLFTKKKTLYDLEAIDMQRLRDLSTHEEFQCTFGPTKLQRHLQIGYNRACWLLINGAHFGILTKTGIDCFPVQFTRNSSNENC